jgi:uncharacterized phosphosugar-binding protein
VSAEAYVREIRRLLDRLERDSGASIQQAASAVADCLAAGHRVWVATTTYCLHEEATGRAGGFIAVHVLDDAALVQPGDVVLIGSPVGTSSRTIDLAVGTHQRGGTVVALTNVEFEDHPDTLLEHPTRTRLHELADIVIDVPGPLGDGVFEVEELELRAIPHSGVTGMTAMWMLFSEALAILRERGTTPRLYQCVNEPGARERNAVQLAAYHQTGIGVLPPRP